ncbi:MAG TPA: hypothetical protein PLX63_08320, partial [Rectinema sp.]|nr:hypothetical protein [Rectinema sp.]HQK10034.1 hypothetical protein [Rectinema sp.]
MKKKICFHYKTILLFLVISVLLLSPVAAQSTPSPQAQQILAEQPTNDSTALAALLDHMLDNHYLPSAQVALGSFTYADTQLPTPFARWFEDELRLA